MASIHHIPSTGELRQILTMLYGDTLELGSGEPGAADAGGKSVVAVYVNDENAPVSACVCDYRFAAFAGSALTKIPRGGAEDAAKSGDFSEMMLGNLREIMNICSRLFMYNSSPHLRLENVYTSPDAVPEPVRAMVGASKGRGDFKVGIPGYGDGNLAFLAT